MKTFLPWLLAVIAAGGAVMFYNANQAKTVELTKLQSQVQELESARGELEELKKNQVPPEELTRLREARDELLRLRNQVRQLTADKSQLSQQAQASQTAAERAQAQAQAAQAQAQAATAERQAAVLAAKQAAASPAVANACINQLRIIDSAKQQWALENNKPANAVPTEAEIAAYLKGKMPVCPGGGKYTLGEVDVVPTCSLPGHALPVTQ